MGQAHKPVYVSQPRQAQTRERAIPRSAYLERWGRRDGARPLDTQPGSRSGGGVLSLEPREEDLDDDTLREFVEKARPVVLSDDAAGELLLPLCGAPEPAHLR